MSECDEIPESARLASNPPARKRGSETQDVIVKLGQHDVLLGRGAPISEYDGNVRLRNHVLMRQEEYARAVKRQEKHRVAMEIVKTVQNNGGRFLRRVGTNDNAMAQWQPVINIEAILGKVKQLLRDMGPEARQKRANRRHTSTATVEQEAQTKKDSDGTADKSLTAQTSMVRGHFEASVTDPVLQEAAGQPLTNTPTMSQSQLLSFEWHRLQSQHQRQLVTASSSNPNFSVPNATHARRPASTSLLRQSGMTPSVVRELGLAPAESTGWSSVFPFSGILGTNSPVYQRLLHPYQSIEAENVLALQINARFAQQERARQEALLWNHQTQQPLSPEALRLPLRSQTGTGVWPFLASLLSNHPPESEHENSRET